MELNRGARDERVELFEQIVRTFCFQGCRIEIVSALGGYEAVSAEARVALTVGELQRGNAEIRFTGEAGWRRLGSLDESEGCGMGTEKLFDRRRRGLRRAAGRERPKEFQKLVAGMSG